MSRRDVVANRITTLSPAPPRYAAAERPQHLATFYWWGMSETANRWDLGATVSAMPSRDVYRTITSAIATDAPDTTGPLLPRLTACGTDAICRRLGEDAIHVSPASHLWYIARSIVARYIGCRANGVGADRAPIQTSRRAQVE